MKTLYHSNKIITILLLAISLTFWGGIIALPILGAWHIGIIIYLFFKKSKLSKSNKEYIYSYIYITATLILLAMTLLHFKMINILILMFIWMFISAFIALYHLYVTYKIYKS